MRVRPTELGGGGDAGSAAFRVVRSRRGTPPNSLRKSYVSYRDRYCRRPEWTSVPDAVDRAAAPKDMPDEGGGIPPERWVGLDLRHFDALEAIADTGSFHGAAARLGYTQSGISRQIASLERTVGRRLVNRPRAGTRLTLTEAGARLLTHASAIRARLAVAQADIATLSQRSELRVHAFPAAARTVMAPVLRALATRPGAPRVELAETPEGNALFE